MRCRVLCELTQRPFLLGCTQGHASSAACSLQVSRLCEESAMHSSLPAPVSVLHLTTSLEYLSQHFPSSSQHLGYEEQL